MRRPSLERTPHSLLLTATWPTSDCAVPTATRNSPGLPTSLVALRSSIACSMTPTISEGVPEVMFLPRLSSRMGPQTPSASGSCTSAIEACRKMSSS